MWGSSAGYKRFVKLAADQGLCLLETEADWLQSKRTAKSRVPLRCNVCNCTSKSSTIHNVSKGQKIRCICSKRAISWNTVDGYNAFKALISGKFVFDGYMDADLWTRTIVGAKSKVQVACCICGTTAQPAIQHVQAGHGIHCFCNGGGPMWKTLTGYKRMLKFVEDSPRFVFANQVPSFDEWTSSSDTTHCQIVCQQCFESKILSPQVMSSVVLKMGCLCAFAAEKEMHLMLKDLVVDPICIVPHMPYPNNLRGTGGGLLRSDFGLMRNSNTLMYIEVDGGYHFGKNSNWTLSESESCFRDGFDKTVRHDLIKEMNCQVPLARVCTDTIHQNPEKVRQWIKELLLMEARGCLEGIHRFSKYRKYSTTVYARLRQGSSIEVC